MPPKSKPLPQQTNDRPRVYIEYDVPEEIWDEVGSTEDFGAIRTFGLKLLTPLEEKQGVARAKGDSLRLAYELAESSIAYVRDENGQEHQVRSHDGTLNMLAAQMHPKLRALIMQAYSEIAAPAEQTTDVFLASRRIRA